MMREKKISFQNKSLGRLRLKDAQTFVEYTMLIGIVVAVMLAMGPLVKRGTQGMVRAVADQIGTQNGADQGDQGHLVSLRSRSATDQSKTRKERLGTTEVDITERVGSLTNQVSNLGYSEEN